MNVAPERKYIHRPKNYEELRQKAVQELDEQVLELEERLANLKKFYHYVENTTDHDSLNNALGMAGVADEDAESFETLSVIADHWPAVSWGPGTGYW